MNVRLLLCLTLLIAPSKCAQHSSPTTTQRNSTSKAQNVTTSIDLTNAPDSELQRHLGEVVTMRGKFSLRGKAGPFVLVNGRPIYLLSNQSSSSNDSYERMEGRDVRVTGTLRFSHDPTPSSQDLPVGRLPDHFYFEAETARVELVRR